MSQVPLFILVHLVGLALMLGFGPRGQPYLIPAAAYPMGLVVAVVFSLVLLLAGVPFVAWPLGTAMAVTAVGGAIAARRRGVDRQDLIAGAAGTVLFAAGVAVLCRENISLMTYDSHQFVLVGHVIAMDGGISPTILLRLENWGVFQIVVQALHVFTLQDYLYAAPAVLSLSFIGIFVTTCVRAAELLGSSRKQASLPVALIALAMFTIYMTLRHMIYVHTNFASGAYLFVFVTQFWIAEVEEDASPLPLAFTGLLGFTLQRVEAPAFAALFVVFTLFRSRLPRRAITPLYAAFTALAVGWYEVLAHNVAEEHGLLNPQRCRLIEGGLLALFLCWLVAETRLLVAVRKRLPEITAVACGVLLACAFYLMWDHMLISAAAFAQNLTEHRFWGLSWYFIVAIVFVSFLLPTPPFRTPFAHAIPTTFAVILLMAVGRVPYRYSGHDSASRMMMHVIPLIFFYIGLKLMRAQRKLREITT